MTYELEILQKMEKELFSDKINLEELYEIFNFVIEEKNKKLMKLLKKKKAKEAEQQANKGNEILQENILTEKKEEPSVKAKGLHFLHDLFNKGKEKDELMLLKEINMGESFANKVFLFESAENTNRTSTQTNTNKFDTTIVYSINSTEKFRSENKESPPPDIINLIAAEITALFPTKEELIQKNSTEILEIMNNKIIGYKALLIEIGKLKYIQLDEIKSFKERVCFWLNCFNYLLLFTLFYKKWNINSEKDWKHFFYNVKYNIGGINFSFNDMQYILFKKPLFFDSSYKINEKIHKFRVTKTPEAKQYKKLNLYGLNPFLIFVPNKHFFSPVVFTENLFDSIINERLLNYVQSYVVINEGNIVLTETLLNYEPNFLYKGLKNYKKILSPEIYNFIKEKKYKRIVTSNIDWSLNFEYLLKNHILELT